MFIYHWVKYVFNAYILLNILKILTFYLSYQN